MSMSAVMVAPIGLAGPSERQILYHELSLVRLKTFVSLINQHLRGSAIRQIGSAVRAPSRGPRCRPRRPADHRKKAMSTLTTPAVPTGFAQALATIVAAAARLAGRFAEAWRHPHDAAGPGARRA